MIQPGHALNVILAAVVLSGGVVVMENMAGIATTDGAVGEEIAVSMDGVFALPKPAATAYTQGKRLYWDNTAKTVTTTATNNVQIGYAAYAASADAATVAVLLTPA